MLVIPFDSLDISSNKINVHFIHIVSSSVRVGADG